MWYDFEAMARYPSSVRYQFGPGGMTPAVKALIIANVAVFITLVLVPVSALWEALALRPSDVVGRGWIWQLFTYQFLHAGVFHILFNMLSLWMFGTDLELSWGSRFFARYYAVTGIGAGLVTVLVSLLPFQEATSMSY